MYNKRLIILILLAIFCIGITISSVSAINIDVNNTDSNLNIGQCNNEENKLEENNLDENIISQSDNDKISSGSITGIDTENYDKYDNTEELTVKVYSNGGVTVYYNIFDSNGNLKYTQQHTQSVSHQWATGYWSFESNYNIFKNLSDGNYQCCLSTSKILDVNSIVNKADIIWNVTKTTPQKIESKTNDYPINSHAPTTKSSTSNHYIKYIKVGKYKVPVLSDDSLKVKKQKVLKYLKKHVKKGKTYKFNGFKFKVSKKQYIQILYKNKFKLGFVKFKIKTNKFKIIKKPIKKYKKVKNWSWIYLETKSMKSYYDSYGNYVTKYYNIDKYYNNGWKLDSSYIDYSGKNTIYCVKLKKKINEPTYKLVKAGYKKVKVRVYAIGHGTKFVPHVAFRAIGKGFNQFAGTGYYYKLK